jgi:hopanoid biosynthesis associated RND transporter like protein HpnN
MRMHWGDPTGPALRSLHPDRIERLLQGLWQLLQRRARLLVVLQLVLAVICALLATRLELRTELTDLVGQDLEFYRNHEQFLREFRSQDEMLAVVESSEPRNNRQFIERLAVKVQAEPALFTNTFYKADLDTLGPKALLFLPETNLVSIRDELRTYLPLIQSATSATNLDSLLGLVNDRFRSANTNRSAGDTVELAAAAPALGRIIDQALYSADHVGIPPSPGVTVLFRNDLKMAGQYLSFAGGRFFTLTTQARDPALAEEAVRRLRDLVAETQTEVPGNNAGVTGPPVLRMDERRQVGRDITVASLVSLVLCAIIFIFAYRETGRPLKATASLVLGTLYAFGIAALLIGHLNIISITFAPILIGLAIDFGVHLVSRYEEDLRAGRPPNLAMRKALVFTGAGVLTGAAATAASFFAMVFTQFKGIREMGIISGAGLLVCLVPMMVLLPAWLLRGRQNILDRQQSRRGRRRQRLEQSWLARPGWTVIVSLLLTALALTQAGRIRFEYNPLELQSRGLASVEIARALMNTGDRSVLYAGVAADSAQGALELEKRLRQLPSVARVESMGRYLAGDQQPKRRLVREIKQQLAPVRFPGMDQNRVNLPALGETLFTLKGYLGLAAAHVRREGREPLAAELQAVQQKADDLYQRTRYGATNTVAVRLGGYQRALLTDLGDTLSILKRQDDSGPLREFDLPLSLRNRFVGRTGRQLLRVYPRKNVWRRDNQEEFVRELRTVAPEATGSPVLLYEYLGLLSRSYRQAVVYALAIMIVIVGLRFRSLICVLLALLPVALGIAWLLGWMGLLGIAFNPVNIMSLPLLVGIGATYGIHILNRYAEERCPSVLARSTGKAVLVSALTTVAGFGSLVLARHQGIASLGYVMAIGVLACLIASLALLPCVIDLLCRCGWSVHTGPPAGPTPGPEAGTRG